MSKPNDPPAGGPQPDVPAGNVVVVIGGGRLAPSIAASVDPAAVIIAADSGLDAARAAGLVPAVLIGDLDSISAAGRMWAYAHELEVHEFPEDKGETDTALALAHAAERHAGAGLTVLGGAGDRLDHTLGTLAALAGPHIAGFASVLAVLGTATIHVLHSGHSVTLDVPASTTFSVFALTGRCDGVTISDARWPLTDAVLLADSTLGVSNETSPMPGVATMVDVRVGPLAVVVP